MSDDELRARVRAQFGDGIPAVNYRDDPASSERAVSSEPMKQNRGGAARSKAANAAAMKKRGKTGSKFEGELDDTHEGFARDRVALILPHYPPTVQIKDRRILKAGGGPCDYSGHVNVGFAPGKRLGEHLVAARDPFAFVDVDREAGNMVQVPVVFDAKVLGEQRASYVHSTERMAQLAHLENAARAGAVAFLLVRADAVGRVFAISYREHADALKRREPITLFRQLRVGSREETRLGVTRQVPAYETVPALPSIGYTPGKGWLWPRLLGALIFPEIANRPKSTT